MTRAECRFGLVPKEHWGYPEWISQEKAAETRVKMKVSFLDFGLSKEELWVIFCLLDVVSFF